MPYELRQWPWNVYPKEVLDDFPEAMADVDVALKEIQAYGPNPITYSVKPLPKNLKGLWQLSMKSGGRQIRLLYSAYGQTIVVSRIHKKSSPQEQQRAYDLALQRKKKADEIIRTSGVGNVASLTLH